MGKSKFGEFLSRNSIWGFAFGYFAAYVPYSLLTKIMSKGLLPSLNGKGLAGFSILPVTALATLTTMIIVISILGWWKYAKHSTVFGISVPHPTKWTLLSGIFTSLIIGTTTLAYTFDGVSIVLAMLLMRGGVLIIAPIVDTITKRHVRWFSWVGLVGALSALLIPIFDVDGFHIPLALVLIIAVYLFSYFMRFQFMSRNAKTDSKEVNLRYFVEEQMVSTPVLVIILVLFTLLNNDIGANVRLGWTAHWGQPYLWALLLIGALSQGTGFFGTLVFLDKSENSYCIPVNRSSSILAGVLASLILHFSYDQPLKGSQLIGAAIIIISILFLTIPPILQDRKKRQMQ
ncbi:MAG: hypothetical protein WCT23_00900 [Candidatus Neomarinimicrobiota bacterium]